ncbi:MAG TPA: YggS family pyridoxal phosphate-dependent enzyme [Chitinophagales bacterium]|nr:YggS family pyridoxal phosphate-dependent enzyme [Chitinophagales bacterium]
MNKITKFVEEHHAQLVVVSKTYPTDRIMEVYHQGIKIFGENKVQELLEKKDLLPADIQWHMIGHLQSNKVKQIVPFVTLIHSVDSEKLLKEIQKQAKKIDRTVDILLQMHIAKEDTKYGLDETELKTILEKVNSDQYSHLRVRGLMGMATFSDDINVVRTEFKTLKVIFDQSKLYLQNASFDTLSMGMSGDYELAIEEGSNMVRIGSLIFGKRNYS